MLNELALIRNGLKDLGDSDPHPLQRIHKDLAEPGKAHLLRVILAPQGSDKIINGLDYLQDNKNTKYWTQGNGNQNQFPAVKLTFPLRREGADEYKQWKRDNNRHSPKSHLKCLENLRGKYPIDFSGWPSWPKYRSKLKQRAEVYRNGLTGDARIVADLLSVFLQVQENGLALLRDLDEKIWQQCELNADKKFLDLAALIMFASLGENDSLTGKGEIPNNNKSTLLLDYVNDSFHSAADKHWLAAISSVLFKQETEGKQRLGTCALSGENTVLVADTFPNQKCEHLGKVTTYSRKKDVPTFLRYGKDAAESMPVSTHLADELASSLRYLNTKDNKGKTWDVLPGETGNGDLLLSFCHALPDIPTARLLAYEPASLDDEDEYESEAEEIFNSFRGLHTTLIPQVDFLIIRKVNDGIQKAIFSSSQSLEDLENSARIWHRASENVPGIKLLRIRAGARDFQSPFAISPKQFVCLFKKQYNRASKSVEVPGLPFAAVMALFLNKHSSKEIADRLLNRLLKQHSGLLELAALKQTNPVKHHYDALCTITAMGLLLHKLARAKEVYMNELAYKLGQLCAALDEIHIGYCESERDGQLPNRLIGNQAYATAVNNPVKALEITAQRAAVYQAWAKKISVKNDQTIGNKKVINAKYALIWLEKHSKELRKELIPQHLNQATAEGRAELLLGYLAGRDFKKPATKEQQGEQTDAS